MVRSNGIGFVFLSKVVCLLLIPYRTLISDWKKNPGLKEPFGNES